MPTITPTILDDAQLIRDYHLMGHELRACDVMLVLGSNDIRVAEHAAQLYHDGYAPKMVFSGGIAHQGDILATGWERSEVEMFAAKAMELGVPSEVMLLEKEATNTGENFRLSYEVMQEAGWEYKSLLVVQNPFMERRVQATFDVAWPGDEVVMLVTSPPTTLVGYAAEGMPLETIINLMVGYLQRIKTYPAKGFQSEQPIPDAVWEAGERLVAAGFDAHVVGGNVPHVSAWSKNIKKRP